MEKSSSKPEGIPVTFEGEVQFSSTPPDVLARRRTQPEKVLRHFERLVKVRDGYGDGPVTLHVHLANACNHTCPWCEPGPYRLAHLTNVPELAAMQLVEHAANLDVKSILLTGGGEPTANPVCGDFVRDIRRKTGIALSMNTNGGLLHRSGRQFSQLREEIEKNAFSRGSIRVTVDAFEKFTHEKFHGKKDWEQVNKNIEWLASMKHNTINVAVLIHESPRVVVSRYCQEGNMEMTGQVFESNYRGVLKFIVHETVLRWAASGVKMVQIRPVYGSSAEENEKIKAAWSEWEQIFVEVNQTLRPRFRIMNWYKSHMDGVHSERSWKMCNMIHLQSTLGANGDAFVCCAMKIRYGQWYDRETGECNWSDLWLSEGRRALAQSIDVSKPECARCSQSAYNDVLYNVDQYATDLL